MAERRTDPGVARGDVVAPVAAVARNVAVPADSEVNTPVESIDATDGVSVVHVNVVGIVKEYAQ